jgi:hypothetical protein
LTEEGAVKLIGQKMASLEYLELSLKALKAEDAVDELKKHLPGLRGVIEEVLSFRRVTKIVKF